jgi:hypothetical protein
MKLNKAILVLFLVISASQIKSQSVYEFLRLGTSPRIAALAGSFVAGNDDPNVIFYNPAGINFLEKSPISFSYLKHLMDINSASLSFSKNFEGLGRFAAGVQYINYGNFTQATADGRKTGEFGAGEIAFVVGYGNELGKDFYYGASVKFIYSGIADQSSTAAAFDIGLNYAFPEQLWNFGFSVLNIGSQLSSYFDMKENLPLDVRFGFTKQMQNIPFKFYWSFNRINEKEDKFFDHLKKITIGGEFRLGSSMRIRLGYDNEKRKELKLSGTSGLSGFSLGLGFNVKEYRVDYSFSSMGLIGGLHRFGISTSL